MQNLQLSSIQLGVRGKPRSSAKDRRIETCLPILEGQRAEGGEGLQRAKAAIAAVYQRMGVVLLDASEGQGLGVRCKDSRFQDTELEAEE